MKFGNRDSRSAPQTSSLPSNGLETSKIGTTHQALRLPELSSQEAEFLSVTSSTACPAIAQITILSVFDLGLRFYSATFRDYLTTTISAAINSRSSKAFSTVLTA